ncbi:MAG: AarF/UbiB family protein [Renibacterium salmoninarum]|nr:AarF/UbiB family protein [Renibacterium salmoninarum]
MSVETSLNEALLSIPAWIVTIGLFAFSAGFLARRLLGVPIGWPRSIVVGLIVYAAGAPGATLFASTSGLSAGTELSPSALGAAALIVVLSFAWAFAFGIGLLVLVEVLWPTGSIPTPLAYFRARRASKARRRRYFRVAALAIRNGLLRPVGARAVQSGTPEATRTARALAKTLNQAGVSFIKLGQTMSTRADMLPAEYISELSVLQTRAEPENWTDLEPALAAALGAPVDQVFASVSTEPLASASVAQVHAAVLPNGDAVVVKVQRPQALAQVTVDLDIIERFAGTLENRTGWGKALGVKALASGFADSLREELDYTAELESMRTIASGASTIRIPTVYPELSSKRVLVMERLDGVPLGEADFSTVPAPERQRLAESLLHGVLAQVVVSGVFHADLHPGNILLLASGELALLDFGSVGRLGKDTRTSLAGFLVAVKAEDNVAAAERLLEMLDPPPELDRRQFERDLGVLLTYLGGSTSSLVTRLFRLVQQHALGVPAQLAAALRAIGALEGSIKLIEPGFDVIAEAQKRSSSLLASMYSAESLKHLLASNAIGLVSALQRLPGNLSSLSEKIEQGTLQVRVRQFSDAGDRSFLTSLAHEGIVALIAIAAVIGSIVLVGLDTGPMLAPNLRLYTFFGYTLALGGFVFGLRTLVRAFRGKRER